MTVRQIDIRRRRERIIATAASAVLFGALMLSAPWFSCSQRPQQKFANTRPLVEASKSIPKPIATFDRQAIRKLESIAERAAKDLEEMPKGSK